MRSLPSLDSLPLVVLVLGAAPAILAAQSDSARAARDTARLSPTVVTVLRTSIELARAPYAVGIATRDEIQRGKIGLALDEALIGIPGLHVDTRFNYALGERISIRGLGARAQFGVRGVRVLLDGIPMTTADGQTSLNNVDVATLGRAEVLRGPASSLHGNAAGGVIQLSSQELPTERAFGGTLRSDVGAHGLVRNQLWLGGRNGATTYSVLGSRMFFDGFRQWNDASNDHVGFNVRRGWEGRSLAINGTWVEYSAKNPGGLNTAMLAANRDTVSPTNFGNRTGEQGRQAQLGAQWSQRVGGTALDLSAHGLGRQVDNPIPGRIVVIDRNAGGARAALSAAPVMRERPLSVSVGAEYQMQRDDRRNYLNSGGNRGADTLDQLERVQNTALFAQASHQVASRLSLMAGVRYDRIGFEATDRLVTPTNPNDSGERTMSATSPSFGATFDVTPTLALFTNFSTSFETPTTSELANQESGAGGFNPTLEPQRSRSAELGANGRVNVAGIAGSYQVAMYQARVEDALIPFEVAALPGRQYFRNAGATKHRGVEVGTSLALPRGVALRGSYTHTEALFEDYAVTTGTTTTVYDGNYVPGVAPNRGDVTLSADVRKVFAAVEARFSSGMHVNDANTATSRTAPYEVYGARIGLRDVRAGLLTVEPHVGVLNVLDRDYMTSVVINAFGGRFYEPGPPRSIYAGLSAKF